jgi:hypothetical protein
MPTAIRTFALEGIAARPVRVEVDDSRGLPSFTIVGLPDCPPISSAEGAVASTRMSIRPLRAPLSSPTNTTAACPRPTGGPGHGASSMRQAVESAAVYEVAALPLFDDDGGPGELCARYEHPRLAVAMREAAL